MALSAQTSNRQVLRLSEALQERQALDPEVTREVQESLMGAPELDVERIRTMPDVIQEPPGGPTG